MDKSPTTVSITPLYLFKTSLLPLLSRLTVASTPAAPSVPALTEKATSKS